jgi:hypothetical protein
MRDVNLVQRCLRESPLKMFTGAFPDTVGFKSKYLQTRRFTYKEVALLSSVSLHVVLVLVILLYSRSNIAGKPEGGTGRAQNPALAMSNTYQMTKALKTVSMLDLMPLSTSPLESTRSPKRSRLAIRQDPTKKAESRPIKPVVEEKSPTRDQDLLDILRETARLETASFGQPDDQVTLTEQIARCLPLEARLTQISGNLIVSLDQYGNLVQVPRVEWNLASISQEQSDLAELIIQATAKCAPYFDANHARIDLTVSLDFTDYAFLGPYESSP